ncbi:cuticle protein CP14.6-like [Episyrphus balteatus]|uniref:cuticle protein CP14.6-like n=1 Tax=Episyrphus balteatus TaxID=286459 RepID=UPI002486443A|nr:cuticle protein CP14.6-like [Episyrphus balteatus]
MKFTIVFVALFSVAYAATSPLVDESKGVGVIRYENTNIGVGEYNYVLETADGKYVEEEGTLKDLGKDGGSTYAVHGKYSYVGPDGVTYLVTYVADENGYQPSGDHLPQLPPQK